MALQELEYDHREFSQAQHEEDRKLAVRFYMDAIQDDQKSTEEGRPIFIDVEMIEIRVRGDRNNVVQRPARDDDRRRFRGPYQAFKDNAEQDVVGTPLSAWPVLSKSLLMELQYMGFKTVEQLAEANDGICSKVAGLQTYKQKAKTFLAYAKDTSVLEKLSSAIAERDNEIEVMKRNHAELLARLTQLETEQQAKVPAKAK